MPDPNYIPPPGEPAGESFAQSGLGQMAVPVFSGAAPQPVYLRADAPQGLAGPTQAQVRANAGIGSVNNPADGQILVWSATLGQWQYANPTGLSELAYAANITGTGTSLPAGAPGTVVDISGCSIVVPASNGRPVTIFAQFAYNQTALGNGAVLGEIINVTNANTPVLYIASPLPNSTTLPANYQSVAQSLPVGVISSPTTFKLSALVWGSSGTPTASTINSATYPSFLRAVAG